MLSGIKLAILTICTSSLTSACLESSSTHDHRSTKSQSHTPSKNLNAEGRLERSSEGRFDDPGGSRSEESPPAGSELLIKLDPQDDITSILRSAKPGDHFRLAAGNYFQQIVINDELGDAEGKPIIIDGPVNGTAKFFGTANIDDIASGPWTHYREGIYKRKLRQPIWQLFLGDQLIHLARWPNARSSDGSIWVRETMAPFEHRLNDNSSSSTVVFRNLPSSSEEVRNDFSRGVAVLNNYNWISEVRTIRNIDFFNGAVHLEGDPIRTKDDLRGYILGLGALDRDEEWWFESDSSTLYYRASESENPDNLRSRLHGRIADYGIEVSKATNIRFRNLEFFSAGVGLHRSSSKISLESIHFHFPNTHKFVLGARNFAKTSNFDREKIHNRAFVMAGSEHQLIDSSVVSNNTILVLSADRIRVENNIFRDIEWDVVSNGGSGSILLGEGARFIRNTVSRAGNSEGIRLLSRTNGAEVAYNDISEMSLLQRDGAAINCSMRSQGFSVHHNWVHDSPKDGIRWDWYEQDDEYVGRGAIFHHNVVWNTEISSIKNDHAIVYNNTFARAHHYRHGELNIDLLMLGRDGGVHRTAIPFNANSVAFNNLARITYRAYEVSQDTPNHYFLFEGATGGADIFSYLRAPSSGDFRPKNKTVGRGRIVSTAEIPAFNLPGSPLGSNVGTFGSNLSIGAYPEDASYYWQPGPLRAIASRPIPRQGTEITATSTDLIFLRAKASQRHIVRFAADPNSLDTVIGIEIPVDVNIVTSNHLPVLADLQGGKKYHWRVDSVSGEETKKGAIWWFSVQ